MDGHLRFHWTVSRAEQSNAELCRHAEVCGIEAMRIPVDFTRPNPLDEVTRIGIETEKIRFMIASRTVPPAAELYLQQMDLISALLPGRVLLEMESDVAPHEQVREFLGACRRLRS